MAAEGGNEASESLFQNGYLCCSKRSRLKSDNDFLFNLLLLLFFFNTRKVARGSANNTEK